MLICWWLLSWAFWPTTCMSAFEQRLYTAAKVHSSDITSLPLHVIVALLMQPTCKAVNSALNWVSKMAFGWNFHIVNVEKTKIEKYQGKLYVHMKVWPGIRKMNLQCRKNPELRSATLGLYNILYSLICAYAVAAKGTFAYFVWCGERSRGLREPIRLWFTS